MNQQAKEKFFQILVEAYSPNNSKIWLNKEEFCQETYGKLIEIIKNCKDIYGNEPIIVQNKHYNFSDMMEQIICQACVKYSSANTEQYRFITDAVFIIYEIY
jgi:hypothetical protein